MGAVQWAVGIALGFVLTQVSFLATSIYMHRTLAHRSLRLSRGARTACRVIIWVSTGICPREWVAVHRKHHAYSDREGDPHSPVLLGVWTVQWKNPSLYRRVARDPAAVARYARDLPPDRLDRVLFDHGWLGLVIAVGAVTAIAGWEIMAIAAVVHGILYLTGSNAINAIGHHWGKRPYDNLATNNRWLAVLVAGEGLHNNHHAAPTSSRFSFASGELDPSWLVIRLLVRAHQATLRHTTIRPRAPLRSGAGTHAAG